jgi:PadR family transcriptional regulator, regulatory protein PadR
VQLQPGTLNALILAALSDGPRHGYAIVEALRGSSDGALEIEEGALYHALHRMERSGWLAAEWRASATNRRAKYYRLTAAGRRELAREAKAWSRYAAFLTRMLHPRSSR